MSRTMISCVGVSKRFRVPKNSARTLKERVLHPIATRTSWTEFQALDNVSFDIDQGEFLGIVGRNGSGKSTLLKTIAGIYHPDRGQVDVNGSLASFIELGVGFNMDLSGRENLFINGILLGLSRKELKYRYDSIVEFAELEDFMDLKLRNYSSGMQVRLAFSVAVESGADILLTDEVLAVGDERFQEKCHDIFQERKARGTTVVFVSHDMAAMQRFCDRVIVMEKGAVNAVGEPEEMTQRYRELNLGPGHSHGSSATRVSGHGSPVRDVSSSTTADAIGLKAASNKTMQDARRFVESAFDVIVRRPATRNDVGTYANQLVTASHTRASFATALLSSAEFHEQAKEQEWVRAGLRARLERVLLTDLRAPHTNSERAIEIPWVLSRTPINGRLLDLGTAQATPSYIDGIRLLVGLDVTTLDRQDHTIEGCTNVTADIRRAPLSDKTFASITAISTINFSGRENSEPRASSTDRTEAERALSEVARLLAPGGEFLMTVPTGERDDLRTSFQEPPEFWREVLDVSGLEVVEDEIYELAGSGWSLSERFNPQGVRYGTRGRYASAVLCIRATAR